MKKKYGFIILWTVIAVVFLGMIGVIYRNHKIAVQNQENSLSVEDGEYVPDSFHWSGGSGRVEITCDKIIVKDGQAYASIIFSSSYYSKVTVDGTEYDGTKTDDTSVFQIPVHLNADNTITGTTTRMSTAHEIEYVIHPTLNAAGEDTSSTTAAEEEGSMEAAESTVEISHTPLDISGLTYESTMELTYATGFDVFYYSDGYALINVYDSAQYLVVPEGKSVPAGLDSSIQVLTKPTDHIYLAATSAMALFRALDSLDSIRLTGTQASGWYVQEAADAMNKGYMVFAGKYSQPDYELLVNEGCKLAIESTMILHAPKVQEMIEQLGIPVFIDRSSYEAHPLGRTEWIKLYGLLTDHEEEAESFFNQQAEVVNQLKDFPNTEKTVAFFYVDTDGTVVVRSSDDYIPSMIRIAGGRYIFEDLTNEESKSASVSLTMEEFYSKAIDADYLIYNGTIDNELTSMEDLIAKNELFGEFKAVKEGNVWTVGKDMYQSTDIVGQLIGDIHTMLTTDQEQDMVFLKKVQ